MSWSRSHFVKMLDDAIADYRSQQFANTVREFQPYQDIGLGDDGSFESLCEKDGYIVYIYELLECWVDSQGRPQDYPTLDPNDWVEIAESLREDIRRNRIPTDDRWNVICTEYCKDCKTHTQLKDGRFACPKCGHEKPFTKP